LKSNYDVRLDQFDYERFDIEERWRYSETVAMLTSYEMEARDLYDRADYLQVCEKIHKKYDSYLFNCLYLKKFEYQAALDFEPEPGRFQFNKDFASFDKTIFLDHLESSKELRIDIGRLKRVLSGEEMLGASKATYPSYIERQAANESATQKTLSIEIVELQAPDNDDDMHAISDHVPVIRKTNGHAVSMLNDDKHSKISLYRFEKHGRSWDIQYGDVILRGVKHLAGMDYIKILLQKPYLEVGVLQLQTILNPDLIAGGGKDKTKGDSYFGIDGESESEYSELSSSLHNKINGFTIDQKKMLKDYKQQLEDLRALHAEAEDNNNFIETSRLSELINIIRDDVSGMVRGRSDDPELEKNRKSVLANIERARDSIRNEELDQGYPETPIYNYLKRFIETGKSCKYNPLVNEQHPWTF